jgi:hypothetical protein
MSHSSAITVGESWRILRGKLSSSVCEGVRDGSRHRLLARSSRDENVSLSEHTLLMFACFNGRRLRRDELCSVDG